MKIKFLILAMALIGTTFVTSSFADSSKYVCKALSGGHYLEDIQKLLNSMKCNQDKPFTVSYAPNAAVVVCCVEKQVL